MEIIKLKKTDVENLDVFVNSCDIRRDLHAFSRYVSYNEIKRAHRDNSLPKAHLKRIAKMMSDHSALRDVDEDRHSHWIAFIDRLSLKLDFIDYEIEGKYMGYSSRAKSYPDNYMEFSNKTYDNFINQSLQEQEDEILKTLTNDAAPCQNEFFTSGPIGILDRFNSTGCATGAMNHIRFPNVRAYLLQLLANCRPGVWYSTASLIEYLKNKNPFFLIPEKLPLKREEHKKDRYHNFREKKPDFEWGEFRRVGNQKDRFERVEGRFVERFLEGLPLNMGYVEVAYSREKDDVSPSMDKLRAFRVTDLLSYAVSRSIKEPEVRVLPNYEIHVDSMFYPAKTMDRLLDLCDLVTEGVHTVLKPVKKKVIEQLAVDEKLDVNGLLKALSGHEIPANVKKEIASWSERADNFIVYQGFGLLEGNMNKETADRFASAAIAPDVNIVRDPKKLYNHLEKNGKIPFYANHSDSALKSLPDAVRSRFAGKKSPNKSRAHKRKNVTLKRTVHTILEFPDREIYEAFTSALLENGSVLNTNNKARTVSYTKKDEKVVTNILNSLKKKYSAAIKDV
jgi:hypothetical protein